LPEFGSVGRNMFQINQIPKKVKSFVMNDNLFLYALLNIKYCMRFYKSQTRRHYCGATCVTALNMKHV
jgi:hypothetical protein